MRRIVGVVLAAGESRRMGRLKALLPFGPHTVLEQVLQPLLQAALSGIVVVVGYRAADLAAVLTALPVQILENPDYQHGMTTSVQVALRHITPLPEAYLLALVDQPNIGLGPVRRLVEAFAHTRKGILIPTYQGKRGHPILLAVRYREAVLALGPQQGLNLVTRGHPEDTLEVPVESDDILRDMDYQADYEAELQRWQRRSTDTGRETRD
jgi:molybdenum cofactor cytidylyltransferase